MFRKRKKTKKYKLPRYLMITKEKVMENYSKVLREICDRRACHFCDCTESWTECAICYANACYEHSQTEMYDAGYEEICHECIKL